MVEIEWTLHNGSQKASILLLALLTLFQMLPVNISHIAPGSFSLPVLMHSGYSLGQARHFLGSYHDHHGNWSPAMKGALAVCARCMLLCPRGFRKLRAGDSIPQSTSARHSMLSHNRGPPWGRRVRFCYWCFVNEDVELQQHWIISHGQKGGLHPPSRLWKCGQRHKQHCS